MPPPLFPEAPLDPATSLRRAGHMPAEMPLQRGRPGHELRRQLPELSLEAGPVPYEALVTLDVQMEDLREALGEVSPSGLREVAVEVLNVRWEDVGGWTRSKRL